ncbi:MAG: peptidoglycan-binding protein [Pseudomonadota bacterium]
MAFWFFQRDKLDKISIPTLVSLLPGNIRYRSGAIQVRYARAIIKLLPRLRDDFGINNPRRLAHFLAQGLIESGFFGSLEEGLYYRTPERIATVYSYKFGSPEDAIPYVKQPKKLANFVYSGRNGNGPPASGDGWRYRGSGLIQLTFRDNYRQIGERIGVNLERNPDRLRNDPATGVLAAAAFFEMNNLLPYADADRADQVSRGVNRGNPNHHKAAYHEHDRVALTQRIQALIANPAALLSANHDDGPESDTLQRGDRGPDVRALQRKLNDLERLEYNVGYADGAFGRGTERAVIAFQEDHGLTADGVVGPDTMAAIDEALADPAEIGSPERRGASASDMADRGVRQAQDGSSVQGAGAAAGTAGVGVAGAEVASEVLGDDEESQTTAREPEPSPTPDVAPDTPAEPPAETMPEVAAPTPAPDPATDDKGLDINWVLIALGIILVVLAVFIIMRGRRIARDTEDGYRAGRISG